MANAEEGTMMSSRALMIGLSTALITVSSPRSISRPVFR